MSRERRNACLGLVIAAMVIAACGGGSSSSSPSSFAGEVSAQFLKSKGDRKYVRFGSEASTQEREAANVVVVKNLEARERADFAAQCETLNLKIITKLPGAKDRSGCAAALKKIAEPLSATKELRKDTLDGSIAAMRVRGDQGYALYHGSDGKNWAVPLEKEGGEWKVGTLVMIGL